MPPIPGFEVLVLGLVLGPILEESFFRGCLLPLLAETTGRAAAVIITAILLNKRGQPELRGFQTAPTGRAALGTTYRFTGKQLDTESGPANRRSGRSILPKPLLIRGEWSLQPG
jgi:hypothetical protein